MMAGYRVRGMSIERLLVTDVAERFSMASACHSAPCVRVSVLRRSAFASAVLSLRNAGLCVAVVPDVAVYWWGLVRVHRVHLSNDAAYLRSRVESDSKGS